MRLSVLAGVAVLTAAAVVAAAVAHGGRPTEPAGDPAAFAVRVVRLIAADRYGRAWDSLDPAQRADVSRGTYVRCELRSAIPGHVVSAEVVDVKDEEISVAGVDGRTASRAVEVRTVIADPVVPEGVVVDQTVHIVAAGGRWAWILPASRYATYAAGRCPS